MSPKLRAHYEAVRKRYVEDASSVAIAHQAHRLRKYEAVYDKALAAKDFSAALKAMELAAKEMGGTLTNQSTVRLEGKVEHRHMSVDDARAELAMRLASMVEGGELLALPSPDTVDAVPVAT